jgi:hypothetical protein
VRRFFIEVRRGLVAFFSCGFQFALWEMRKTGLKCLKIGALEWLKSKKAFCGF